MEKVKPRKPQVLDGFGLFYLLLSTNSVFKVPFFDP